MCTDITGTELQGRLVLGYRVRQTSRRPRKGIRQIVVSLCVARLNPKRRLKLSDCLRQAARHLGKDGP